jgi:phosphoglycolate phosphatase
VESRAAIPVERASSNTSDDSVWTREINVIGGGLKDGSVQAAQRAASDIKAGWQEFSHNPLSATKHYIGDHWKDIAAGAAISFVAPSKWATAALGLYSVRDLLAGTARASVMALDPANDQQSARRFLSDNVAATGEAMITSLPATAFGGMLGRGVANNVFGRGNGLFDMLPTRENGEWVAGKVTPDMVRSQLSDIKYAYRPRPTRIVFTDLDNTLVAFSPYEALGVKEGITNMATRLHELGFADITEEELYKSIGHQMDLARSHDYPWSVELALKDRLRVGQPDGMSVQQFRTDIVEPFWRSIDAARADHMELLPGVKEGLEQLKADGMPVVIVSDAPYYAAMQRSVQAGLDKYVDGFYALNNVPEPVGLSDELLAHGRERISRIMSTPHQFKFWKAVPKEWEKPNPYSFQELLQRYGDESGAIDPHEATMIGDSRTKDVEGARRAGMVASWRPGSPVNALWAEYGNPPQYFDDILLRLRPLPENQSAPGLPKVYPTPLKAATEFTDILDYLDPNADPRYLAINTVRGLAGIPRWQSLLGFNPIPNKRELRMITASSSDLLSDYR